MPVIDIYLSNRDEQRRHRRKKWFIPLIVGVAAAFALGREKPPAQRLPKPVVASPPVHVQLPPAVVEPPLPEKPPTPTPARIAVAPTRFDFGDGPLTRGIPAQIATIRNEGGQSLARVTAIVDGPFMATSGCAEDLAPGDQCVIALVFAPKQPGRFAGSLKITAGEETVRIPLRGSVPHEVVARRAPAISPEPLVAEVTPPAASTPAATQIPPPRALCFEPPLVRFTSTGRQTITLTNPDATPVRVVAVLPIGNQGQTVSGYEIESSKCLRVLEAQQQCKFTVRANKFALQTRETIQLTVYYDDPVTGGTRPARFVTTCGGGGR